VEGDTTRFGPVYMCGPSPAAIGPVRSARYYNTDLFQQLHAVTLHFGAGTAILREFGREAVPYVNGLTGFGGFFARSGSRPAPHNVYLDLAAVREAAESGALGERPEAAGEPRGSFVFDPDATLEAGRAVSSVLIYTNSYWNFGWSWDTRSSHWHRNEAGQRATDALTGHPLTARYVVVQLVTQTVLDEYDPGGYPRRRQHLVGSGDAILYANGSAVALEWSRASKDAVTTWTYADSGEPLVLPPGRVWWEILPVGSTITER
jgi:hypothetical protein